MAFDTLLVTREDRIGVLTINRPKQLNALNSQVYSELYKAILDIVEEGNVRVLIITGAGNKAFVAGADITEMEGMSSWEARKFALLGKKVGELIESIEIPVIAAVNGFALGGGCELAMSCDILLASEIAKFGQPEINLGLIPGNGGTQRLSRLIGLIKAKELIFLGETIDAKLALEIGLVNMVVPGNESVLDEAKTWAKKLLEKSSVALALAKSALNQGTEVELGTALNLEIECFAQCFATADQKEGARAFLERRKPQFKGI